jgi:hypothetical protein
MARGKKESNGVKEEPLDRRLWKAADKLRKGSFRPPFVLMSPVAGGKNQVIFIFPSRYAHTHIYVSASTDAKEGFDARYCPYPGRPGTEIEAGRQ